MRGLTEFYCDLYDDIGAVTRTAARINRLFLEVLDQHFAQVSPKLGGYSHIFGYWAPARTIVIQQDVLGACSPAVYRDHFQALDAELVRHVCGHVLFHLHSTGCRHYPDVLSLPGLAGLEITIEANGPPVAELLPMFRDILKHSRLILHVDARFDELPAVLRQLPRAGLYVVVRDDHVRSDGEFQRFLATVWGA